MRRFARTMVMTMTGTLAGGCDADPQSEVAALRAELAEQTAAIEALTRQIDELEARRPRLRRALPPAVLSRADLAALLDGGEMFMKARVMPSVEEGGTRGFKLHAIPPGTPIERLGLKKGDLVRAVGGYELTSTEEVLKLRDKLRARSSGTIEIVRGGEQLQIAVEIKD